MAKDEHPLPGLEKRRQQLFLTQEELAKLAGIGGATVSRIERGGAASLKTIRKLAVALDCTPAALIEPE